MAVIEQLLREESDGTISFGNHKLEKKEKVEDFKHAGDLYKVKTYAEMTKLEKNGMFAYESEPGTSVNHFNETEAGVTFSVEANEDVQITVGLQDESEYEVFINNASVGKMNTNLSGKLSISVELEAVDQIEIKIIK